MKIGDRVKYVGDWDTMRDVTGTVVKTYAPHREVDENGEPYISHHAVVKVDRLPENWPYDGNDKFAPSVTDLQVIA